MWNRPRQWRLDVAVGGLFLLGLIVSLAVFSYEPGDDPYLNHPANESPHNLLGWVGVSLSHALMQTLGVAVYALLAGWFVLIVLLFLRRGWLAWSRRLCGWLLLVPALAVLADRYGGTCPVAALLGPGGSLGAWLGAVLEQSFSAWAQRLILLGALGLGFLFALDFVLRPAARWSWPGTRRTLWLLYRVARRFGRPIPIRREGSTAPKNEEPLIVVERSKPAAVAVVEPAPPPAVVSEEPRTIPIHHHDALLPQSEPPTETKLPLQLNNAKSEQERFADYQLPPLTLLENPQPFTVDNQDQQLRDRAALLEKTFTDFGINVRVVGINTGPVITQFEIALETGLRVNKVTRLADDLALNLSAASVRMVAPIPGKNTVGIEIPNEQRADVRLKEVMLASSKLIARSKLPLFLGKDAEGRPLIGDLANMPHLLIAGSTGTGKSVCMNTIILSLLMTRRPDEVKLIMIDPKVVEMDSYSRIPHLMHPVVGDMKKAEAILGWAVDKMEERYDLLRRARVRNIASYNELPPDEILRRVAPLDDEERKRIPLQMPYIVIFVDEMADLILQMRKEVEGHIIRLAQKSRAAGIHLVVATQKPTVDVITGLIKSNLPARICFKVVNKSDSRVVLDEMGADKLLGKGDMLFLAPGTSNLIRAQGTFASDQEIASVVGALEGDPCYAVELMQLKSRDDSGESGDLGARLRGDDLYEPAVDIVIREGRGSVSLLQRALGIGYGRAARLIDYMAEDGIVGAYNGSNAREVKYSPEEWQQLRERVKTA